MSPAEYTQLPIVTGEVLKYGALSQQFGHLHLPRTEAPSNGFGVVVLLHGGCWRDRFGLEPLGQMADALTDHGLAVWNLEYRRLGGGGGWPSTFEDVAAGADFLAELAARYPLDLSNVVAAGHSAGGHLAMWLTARANLPDSASLFSPTPLSFIGTVSLAGIPDLVAAVDEGICSGAPSELMGGEPSEVPQHYAQGSPHALLPLPAPHVHVVGAEDPLVPADYVKRFVEYARGHGDDAEMVTIPQVGHFEVVTAGSRAWAPVRDAILASFER
ncbi:MAG: alpha/beta hydrolase [Gammaproteobacteria bacterium]|nr:alpha/beta hydrolase [Gammaproteobacteria bacterium]